MFQGEKSKVDLDELLNLGSASYSSESQFYQEDIYLCTSGAGLPWQFFSSPGLKIAKMEGYKAKAFLRKCSSGYPDLY